MRATKDPYSHPGVACSQCHPVLPVTGSRARIGVTVASHHSIALRSAIGDRQHGGEVGLGRHDQDVFGHRRYSAASRRSGAARVAFIGHAIPLNSVVVTPTVAPP